MTEHVRVPVEVVRAVISDLSGDYVTTRAANSAQKHARNRLVAMLAAAPADDELARLERFIMKDKSGTVIENVIGPWNLWGLTDDNEWWITDELDDEDDREYADACLRYLELRGLLERHPDNPTLVRVREVEG